MEFRTGRGIPMVPLVTFVLASVLLILVGGLFVTMDRILEDQVRRSLANETQAWADSLAASSAKVLWNFDEAAVQALGDHAFMNPLVLSIQIQNDRYRTLYRRVREGPPLTTVRIPVRYGGTFAGSVELTSAAALVRTRVEALEIPASLAGGLFFLLLVIFTPIVLTSTVLWPILRLGRLVEAVDPVFLPEGALETGSGVREVRALEKALGTMAVAVRENMQTLEDRVEERTKDLNVARAQLAHAEALVTLSHLTAGIAHELNTPLAAILSSIRTLETEVLDEVLELVAESWPPARVDDPIGFLRNVSRRARTLESRRSGSPRAQLKVLWESSGRTTDSDLFDLLACEALLPVGKVIAGWPLATPEETGLKVVILSSRLLEVINMAAEKGAAVVQALRGHLKYQEDEPSVWFDAAESIERCLILHQGHLGTGIEVRRDCQRGLSFFGPESRLGQVWLNLINNAFEAVGTRGWIEVDAVSEGEWAEVRVSDSGPAVPPEFIDRLFEPYFTTKSTGLGLGLHLSRAFVETLGGNLIYEDSKGEKSFVVRWPQPVREPAVSVSSADSG